MIENPTHELPKDTVFDIAVIGAGVVGCAVARRFALEGASVLVLEKASDILDGASKGNSAILHTGFDEPSDFLELQCIKDGYQEYMDIHERLGLPVMKTGALVVAWNREEEEKLDSLVSRAHANGIDDVVRLSTHQILDREPHLSTSLTGGFLVPREFVIDPWTTPYAYLMQAIENGAQVIRKTELLSGSFDGGLWRLNTSNGDVNCRTVINCAGLYGDRIDEALLGKAGFTIKPRKGQFLVYDKPASKLVSAIILPVPSETTKGVVITRTVFGNVLVGPTAEEQESRDDASVDRDTLLYLKEKGEEMIPALAGCGINATYAGIRPATETKDYCIAYHDDRSYISVGGIRSTGLSAALGIASYIYGRYSDAGHAQQAVSPCKWPDISPIAEDADRDWRIAGNGGIVCHCELVTRREVERALTGPLAASSLSGLKRRTRVTMGRCQGFYCSGQLSELTAGHFDQPIGLSDDSNR